MSASLAIIDKADKWTEESPLSSTAIFHWSDKIRQSLGKSIFLANHTLHDLELFSDEKLAELLDQYPREKLGIYRFPSSAKATQKAEQGCAPTLTGAEIMEAVRNGKIWLNLRAVNTELPEYEALAGTVFDQLKSASGIGTFKEDMGVLISSPNIHVHYHLDIPLVCLVQIRGEKKLSIYPTCAPFVKPDQLAAFALRRQDEQMTYSESFEDAATHISLKAGQAVTWPQTAPHRVQNANSVNVSLSCEFMTVEGIIKANALHTHAIFRKEKEGRAAFPEKLNAFTLAKAVTARALKKLSPLPEKSPSVISFELVKGGGVRPLFPQASQTKFETSAAPTCRVAKPEELTVKDRSDWKNLQRSHFQYSSPLSSPDFMDLIAKTRRDVRCILIHRGPKLLAVLPVFERNFGLIRPVGAPFSDYSGPLLSKNSGLTLEDIIALSGYAAYRSDAVLLESADLEETGLAESGLEVPHLEGRGNESVTPSFVIHLNGQSAEEHLETNRAKHAKRYKNFRRLANKLERECGKIDFIHGPVSEQPVATLLKWKSEQFLREGLLDITTSENSASILKRVSDLEQGEGNCLSGYMTGLKVNDTLIAGHFGVRDETNFHPWISAYDPEFEDYSPGLLLLSKIVEEMGPMGLETYDLSTGHESYKKYFCNAARYTREVHITTRSLRGWLQKVSYQSWDKIGGKIPTSPAARMRRRFDHIFVCEPKMRGRMKQLILAFVKRSRMSG